jgi:4-aminobutyrate aminotransferase/(S)-3-amino-2-methylpropionate transaminase
MDVPDKGEVGGTYGGNPVACAAALKTLEIVSQPGFAKRAAEIGKKTREGFLAMQEKYPIIGDVRGQGAMVAMEFVKDRETKEPLPVKDIVQYAVHKGLILLSAGVYNNVIRVLMPLVITDDQLEEGLAILDEAIQKYS